MAGLIGRAAESVLPCRYYESLVAVDPVELKARGIRGLLLDLDSTMVPRNVREATEELKGWLDRVRDAGLVVCVVSNNFKVRVREIAGSLDLPLVAPAAKPRARAFQLGMKALGTRPEETAVIGDQLFTDVLGGNRQGLYTVLVVPLPGPELPHTLLLRRIERWLLSHWVAGERIRLERGAEPPLH